LQGKITCTPYFSGQTSSPSCSRKSGNKQNELKKTGEFGKFPVIFSSLPFAEFEILAKSRTLFSKEKRS